MGKMQSNSFVFFCSTLYIIMKKAQNRFSIVNSYKKEQSIELLGKLTVEQLLTIINFKFQ